jgi:predicted acyltransferase
MGVLQRIGLSYGCAALLILKLNHRQLVIFSGALLLLYWLILWCFGIFSGLDPYSLESNLPRWIDLALFGDSHLYHGTGIPFDPEGLLSTLPAITTVIIGYITGKTIQEMENGIKKIKYLLKMGATITVIGWIWGFLFPINKQLWTSSYVLFTGGLAIMALAIIIFFVDIKGLKKLAQPFIVFGTNSIFLFVASGLWVKIILKIKFILNGKTVSGYTYLYQTVFQPLAGNLNGSLLFALSNAVVWWLVLYYMYRKNIFIKV